MGKLVNRVALFCSGFILFAFIASVHAAPGSLSVGFSGTHASRGSFVDISANQDLDVTGFDLNLASTSVTINIYYKGGATTMGDTTNSGAWTLHDTVNVTGNGQGAATNISITPFSISSGQTIAFYIAADADSRVYNLDDPAPTGISSANNSALSISSAYESHGLFSSTYNGWGWQGTVYYDTVDIVRDVPTLSEWGMIVLSLLLAGGALWFLRRRPGTGQAA